MKQMYNNDMESRIIVAVLGILEFLEEPPTSEEIFKYVKNTAKNYPYTGDIQAIVKAVEERSKTRADVGVRLTDRDIEHESEWVENRVIIDTYTKPYFTYLIDQGWNESLANTLVYQDCNTILSLMQDPQSPGPWRRRGLVIGHVQSGKTANYIGVICRAADAGYKFIIVIAGIHNNLRTQTQQRIEEGFVGQTGELGFQRDIGVGRLTTRYDLPKHQYPWCLTDLEDDFKAKTATAARNGIDDSEKPIIMVIKKNVTTLKVVHKWLKDVYKHEAISKSIDTPMLIIDDEADNASINTKNSELDPTRINAQIRSILSLFSRSCYIGYTATPFANIFINPKAVDKDSNEDLFPKDFIYLLNPPTNYFGPDRIFCEEEQRKKTVCVIDDCEELIPLKHKKDLFVRAIPETMKNAVNQFLIASAIRLNRGQTNKHSTMLINVSRFVPVQQQIRSHVDLYLKYVREAVAAYYCLEDDVALKNDHMAKLKQTFDEDYSDGSVSWVELKPLLRQVTQKAKTVVINGKSPDILDYQSPKNKASGLTLIAIGGLSLSRGLTLEGLTISYMHRNTKMYDTLMQMGRWFGYRSGYEDLCRVHLPEDSVDWYSHIAEATEELREQIRQMQIKNRSPKDFGLYVRSHPDSLLITSKGKMRSGEKVKLNQNYSAKLIESHTLSLHADICNKHEQLIKVYWDRYFKDSAEESDKGFFVRDVDTQVVINFLNEFQSHPEREKIKEYACKYLSAISGKYPRADVILVSKGNANTNPLILGPQSRSALKATIDSWHLSQRRVAAEGVEAIGLTDSQKEDAVKLARKNGAKPGGPVADRHYREIRDKPLLMIHILTPIKNEKFEGMRVPAWGLSFPFGEFEGYVEVEVYANPVWTSQQLEDASSDDSIEEDEDE